MSHIKYDKKQAREKFQNYNRNATPDKSLYTFLRDEGLGKALFAINKQRWDKESPMDYSLEEGLQKFLGIQKLGDLFHALELSATDSFGTIAHKMGQGNFEASDMKRVMIAHGNFNAMSTTTIDPTYALLISELALRPIRVGRDYARQSHNWVAGSMRVNKLKGEIEVRSYDVDPKKVKQGTAGRRGSVKLTTKPYEVEKLKVIVEFTNEMIMERPYNIIASTLQEIYGGGLARQEDGLGARTLFDGETKKGATFPESADVIGIEDDSNGVQHTDIERVVNRTALLDSMLDSAILSEATLGNNLYKGQNQPVQYFRNAYSEMNRYSFPLPENKEIFFDSKKAMRKVDYGSLVAKQDEDIATDVLSVAVSAYAGFVILKRDARIVLDRSTTFDKKPFSKWMGYNETLFGNPYSWN